MDVAVLVVATNATTIVVVGSGNATSSVGGMWENASSALSPLATARPYGGDHFTSFSNSYKAIHGYLSVVICAFGIVSNVLNLVILTRKNMITPTNSILTGLAVADMLVMLSSLPFSLFWHILFLRPAWKPLSGSFGWNVFMVFHMQLTVLCHTISIWLTVLLAVFRYIAISYPSHSRTWCNLQRATQAISIAYAASLVLCIPNYLNYDVQASGDNVTTSYTPVFSSYAVANDALLKNMNFWIYGVIVKLIPCIALTMLSSLLMRALYTANERKQKLASKTGRQESDKTCDRTTRMLLVILLLFLITEFPQGILSLLSGILGDEFFSNVYVPLGDLMDIIALANCAVNFILYCTMSKQFRETFRDTFKPGVDSQWTRLMPNGNSRLSTMEMKSFV
ncbi:PREDICTED: sex peptide receptor-like [Priapulus caudatus]|uniref:Sex peptide receptor-like n=1 Tax=Priapulus caudatus TaxID=37621 RepID=A0ABM1EX52_PRICU|nr:PREDICTED: sex peptide receptor-like [Priapulus caudatus]